MTLLPSIKRFLSDFLEVWDDLMIDIVTFGQTFLLNCDIEKLWAKWLKLVSNEGGKNKGPVILALVTQMKTLVFFKDFFMF